MAPRRRRLLAAGAGGALAGLGLLALRAGWIEPRRLVVREQELRLARWPRELDGLRVALVSDLHAGGPHMRPADIERVARRTVEAHPDVIALLGDVVDPRLAGGAPVAPEAAAWALRGLRAPVGVLAVLGNHDWTTDGPRVGRALRAAGIAVLENDAVRLGARGQVLHIAGLADAKTREPDLGAALAGVPESEPVLLLSHDPDVFPSVPARVALTLSGHTHGGQIDLPVLRDRATPSRYGGRYRRGLVVEDGRHLFVTSGVGTSRWPVRLRRPPEVVVLRLRSAGPGCAA